mmetsp:Transcript_29928/g.29116  ORF Transcript_29928/g.29116 Transcript_29928/m.29116 type:complete len:87 (+) Transcript_29928:661-921(+)
MGGHQGYMLNNFFPALENEQHLQDGSNYYSDEGSNNVNAKDKYPKFSSDNINSYPGGLDQEQIDEVPPEEEGESQEFGNQKAKALA